MDILFADSCTSEFVGKVFTKDSDTACLLGVIRRETVCTPLVDLAKETDFGLV